MYNIIVCSVFIEMHVSSIWILFIEVYDIIISVELIEMYDINICNYFIYWGWWLSYICILFIEVYGNSTGIYNNFYLLKCVISLLAMYVFIEVYLHFVHWCLWYYLHYYSMKCVISIFTMNSLRCMVVIFAFYSLKSMMS